MKTYSSDSQKLYESRGFTMIEVGKTYTSKNGSSYSVKSIVIDATSMKPDVTVTYDYVTEGKEGEESNSFTVFVNMLRS